MTKFQKIYDEEFFLLATLPSRSSRVLAALLKHAQNKDTFIQDGFRYKSCYPSQKSIASFIGCTVRSVQRGIKELIDLKLLEVQKTEKRNIYTIFYPLTVSSIDDYLHGIGDKTRPTYTTKLDQIGDKTRPDRRQNETIIGDKTRPTQNNENQYNNDYNGKKNSTEQMSKEKEKRSKKSIKRENKYLFVPSMGGFDKWQ